LIAKKGCLYFKLFLFSSVFYQEREKKNLNFNNLEDEVFSLFAGSKTQETYRIN